MFTLWLGALRAVVGFVARFNRHSAMAALAATALILQGCGGGGGGGNSGTSPAPGNVSLSVSPLSISVSATTVQAAPVSYIQVYANGLTATQQVYVAAQPTKNGISSVSLSSGESAAQITVQFISPGTLGPGTYSDTIQVLECYDQACTQQVTNSPQTVQVQYVVTDTTVKLTSLSPSSTAATGPAFTLTVNGTNFTSQSSVEWNNSPRVTTFVSATQLTAQITAADIATSGTASVSVNDSTNGLSNSLNFSITAAQLSLGSISPTSTSVGGTGFMLTVLGTGFTGTSTVLWNGTTRTTTLVSGSELVAQITAADIASLGTATVSVQDPSSSIGTTPTQTFTIAPVSIDAVAFQINPAHTGSVSFSNISLPTTAAWSVNVGGTPSYALIVNGLVIVTVSVGSGGSQLVALEQATGATVWGPIAIGGSANAAYDSGKVFVLSSTFGNAAAMTAYDAQTGTQLWSTLLSGQYAFSAALTAANGFVYTGGAGDGGTLYAVNETNGAIAWTQEVENGDNSTPAVTADGVYVTYPCWTYDFRPATGDSIWSVNTGCEGGGGATPVVADQLVYSPNLVSGNNGTIYNAETGTSSGTYSADSPPAFMSGTGYFLQSGTLRAISQSNSTVAWSFAGDGQLTGSPIVVGSYVFIASASGNLYGLSTSGQQVWQVTLASPVVESTQVLPFSGLSAGDGLLVVPTGSSVTTYVLSTNP